MNRRKKAYILSNGRCFYCGQMLRGNYVLDHMIPQSKGGKGGENLVACCRDCNAFKSDLSVEEFRAKIESMIDRDFHGRIYKKYFGVRRRHFKFYFEKENLMGDGLKNG